MVRSLGSDASKKAKRDEVNLIFHWLKFDWNVPCSL